MESKPVQHTIDTPYLVGPVHCYTVERDGELCLFDTGPPTREAKNYLQDSVNLARVKHVFITHCHIDHYGLAHWLEHNTEAAVYLPYRDSLKITQHDYRMQQMYTLLLGIGFSKKYLNELREIFDSGVLFPAFPENYKIAEKDVPEEIGIEVINCPGHSQSDVVYAFDDFVVSGDTLLRGIFQSPLLDVDLITGERFNNYDAYCQSIVKLSALNGKTVLPGHRKSVESVNDTLLFYIGKMLIRVEQMRPYANERNVAKIIETLFNNSMTDVFHIYLKASEILFMQDFLAAPEKLGDSLHATGLFDSVADQFNHVTGR